MQTDNKLTIKHYPSIILKIINNPSPNNNKIITIKKYYPNYYQIKKLKMNNKLKRKDFILVIHKETLMINILSFPMSFKKNLKI